MHPSITSCQLYLEKVHPVTSPLSGDARASPGAPGDAAGDDPGDDRGAHFFDPIVLSGDLRALRRSEGEDELGVDEILRGHDTW